MIENWAKEFFFMLDKIIYGFIDDVYELLLQLARTSIFTQDTINEVAKRIYALVGIFMLFKVTISIITYVLNPDDFSDKTKGFTNVVKRVILSLVMVVLCPYIFSEAYGLQTMILEENTIMNLVFGTSADEGFSDMNYVNNAGKKIQFTIAFAFSKPNVSGFANDAKNLNSCKKIYQTKNKGDYIFRKLPSKFSSTDSHFIYELEPSCFGTYNADMYLYDLDGDLSKMFNNSDTSGDDSMYYIYQNYAQGIAQQSFDLFFKKEVLLARESGSYGEYLIDYKFGISTFAGIAVLYLLLMFCIDIATRSIQLGFLQIIAPVPIISYCDPKSGKDSMFSKWLKKCIDTYLELFIRLFALYFGIYIISLMGTFRDVITNEKIDNWLVIVFMCVGVLIFIKKLPDILKDVFNTKGKFEFNPVKKMENEALGGKRITGAVAGGAAGIAGGRGLSGAWEGFWGNKGLADTFKHQKERNATMRTARLNGSTFGGRLRANLGEITGTGGPLAQIEREKHKIQDNIDREESAKKVIEGQIAPKKQEIADYKRYADDIKAMEQRAKDEIEQGNGGSIGKEYLRRKAVLEHLKNNNGSAEDIANAELEMNKYLNDEGMKQYMSEASTHTGNFAGDNADKTFDNMRKNAELSGKTVGISELPTDGKKIHGQMGAAKGKIGDLQREIYDQEQQIETYNTNIKDYNSQMQEVNKRESVAKANQSAVKK